MNHLGLLQLSSRRIAGGEMLMPSYSLTSPICTSACVVIPKPISATNSALTVGNILTSPTGVGSRSNSRLPQTSSNPSAVSTPASPKLNANTSTSPKPIRPRAIALSSTTRAEGQGTRPPEMPKTSRLRQVTGAPSAPGGKCEWSP
jgi:hypothetical protein